MRKLVESTDKLQKPVVGRLAANTHVQKVRGASVLIKWQWCMVYALGEAKH